MQSKVPDVLELLHNGVHFGHKTSKWHPKMQQYIFAERNGVHILDLEKTKEQLEKVCDYVATLTKQGKTILFLGTKRQAKEIVKKYALSAGMPYIIERWIGGLFTNFSTVSRLMRNLLMLKKKQETGELKKYTKKEQLEFQREIDRLEKLVGGITELKQLPDALFVVGVREEKTAVREARKKYVPIIGIADSNIDPDTLDWCIPANDDAIKSIEILVKTVSEAIQSARTTITTSESTATESQQAVENQKTQQSAAQVQTGDGDMLAATAAESNDQQATADTVTQDS